MYCKALKEVEGQEKQCSIAVHLPFHHVKKGKVLLGETLKGAEWRVLVDLELRKCRLLYAKFLRQCVNHRFLPKFDISFLYLWS